MFSFIKSLLGKLLLKVVKSNFWSDELRIRLVKWLLACGANHNVQDSDGYTSLHFAIEKGDHEMAELLIEEGANPDIQNKNGWTPLHFAVSKNDYEMVRLLIKNEANIDTEDSSGRTPLQWVVYHNNCKMAELLISLGAYFDAKEIDYCHSKGYTLMAQLLASHRDKKKDGPTTRLQSSQSKSNITKEVSPSLS